MLTAQIQFVFSEKHLCLTDEFIKDKKEFSSRVTFCIVAKTNFSLTDIHETNGKCLLSDTRDCPLPSTQQKEKTTRNMFIVQYF